MPYISCFLAFRSDKSLEDVARLISDRLFAGISFVGKDKKIYDEVPAVFLEHDVLGLFVSVCGDPGPEGYNLLMSPRRYFLEPTPIDKMDVQQVNVACYIGLLLKDLPGIVIEGL